jgi:hypothetical protein
LWLACGAVARRCAAGVSGGLGRERQGGQGLVSRSHARLNLRLDGLVRRACAKNCLGRTRAGRARGPPRNALMPATPATDHEPSPCPPCRCYFIFCGRGGVSRPIEGLDSFGAVRTLRMRRTPASTADASRPRNSSNIGGCLGGRSRVLQQHAWIRPCHLPRCDPISSRCVLMQKAAPDLSMQPTRQTRSGPVRAQTRSP